jgi:hypothetical protein
METSVTRQLLEAAAALSLGAAAGLLYDFFRVLRARLRLRVITVLCDVLFCVAAGTALFLLGLTVGGGRQRVALGVFAALGGSLYFLTLSRLALYIFRGLADVAALLLYLIARPAVFFAVLLKKIVISLKKLFHYARKWYIFGERHFLYNRKTAKESVRYAEKNKFLYEGSLSRDLRVPHHPDHRGDGKARQGRPRPRGAARRDRQTRGDQRRHGI